MTADMEVLCTAAARIFIYAFPLLLADAVRRVHPLPAHQFHIVPEGAGLAPGLEREDPRAVITSAWIDLATGPVVLTLPETHGRHCSLTLLDTAGETFASFGARGEPDRRLAVVSPQWRGELPEGLTAKRSPSEKVWAVGRCYAHSALDRKATLSLVRSQRISDLETPIERLEMATLDAPRAPCAIQAAGLSPAVFFHRLDSVLRHAPAKRAVVLEAIAALREELGGPPPFSDWSPRFAEALEKGLARGLLMLRSAAELYPADERSAVQLSRLQDGGGDPPTPAVRAWRTMGAPPAEDLLVLNREVDATGRRLTGRQSYRLHLRADALPPARAFWRLYTHPAPGPQHRLGVGDRSDLALNPDGSVDIFIQAVPPPAAQISNWLPAPAARFVLHLALHSPSPAALSGGWHFPPVVPVEEAAGPGTVAERDVDCLQLASALRTISR
jgi:hypothetical protein